jgi:hypothetical protein
LFPDSADIASNTPFSLGFVSTLSIGAEPKELKKYFPNIVTLSLLTTSIKKSAEPSHIKRKRIIIL